LRSLLSALLHVDRVQRRQVPTHAYHTVGKRAPTGRPWFDGPRSADRDAWDIVSRELRRRMGYSAV
jgi:hypothetical protein